jgi:hypothetical protein
VDRPACGAAVLLAKATPAEPLGQQPVAGDSDDMAPVKDLGALAEDQVRDYLATLSNTDRAALMIQAIMRAGVGRRY